MNATQLLSTKQLINKAIATGNYTKPNGKLNQSKLASDLGLHRNTIINHLKANKC